MAKSSDKYHISLRIVHWLMAVMILGLIVLGWFMQGLDKDVSYRNDLYGLHKSFGVTVLFLVVLRVALRISTVIPPLPETLPKFIRKVAHLVHHIIYLFIFAVPISGYMMSNMFGYGVSWFGISLPKLFSPNKEIGGLAHEAHAILPYMLLALVTLHVAGAIKHKFFEKDKRNDVLKRML